MCFYSICIQMQYCATIPDVSTSFSTQVCIRDGLTVVLLLSLDVMQSKFPVTHL
jgi:hypothetical protein